MDSDDLLNCRNQFDLISFRNRVAHEIFSEHVGIERMINLNLEKFAYNLRWQAKIQERPNNNYVIPFQSNTQLLPLFVCFTAYLSLSI